MTLLVSEQHIQEIIELRRYLHAHPELSGRESRTASTISRFLGRYRPDELHTGVGGHGVLAVFDTGRKGPVVVLRCELDALPIQEDSDFAYRSTRLGVSHKCGHDGHMATVAGLAGLVRSGGVGHGKVVLLFQPAEESGVGAMAVLSDPRFQRLKPDYVFGFHNLPKFPLGDVVVREGVFAFASSGMMVRFKGIGTHSSYPEHGCSTAPAVADLLQHFTRWNELEVKDGEDPAMLCVTHASLGEWGKKIDYGVAPDRACVVAVLRAARESTLDNLKLRVAHTVKKIATQHNVGVTVEWHEEFTATVNQPTGAAMIRKAAHHVGLRVEEAETPFRWSEDFGHFLRQYPGAFFGIGSGEDHPQLHHPDYDYPDELIPAGLLLYQTLLEQLQGSS